MRSASSSRPCCASQRGLSGTMRMMKNTSTAASAGTAATKRQPAIPNGSIGTSNQLSSATIGTEQNWIDWFAVKARPRISFGTSSAM
jgi:hypothetical protein